MTIVYGKMGRSGHMAFDWKNRGKPGNLLGKVADFQKQDLLNPLNNSLHYTSCLVKGNEED
jgi:hypothetical protein